MKRTLKVAVFTAIVTVLFALMPRVAQAQEAIECWQEGAFNGPHTCVCTTGYWLWLQPHGTGFCPWDEAGKTSSDPGYEQQPTAPLQPIPTVQNTFPYPEGEQEKRTEPPPYYDPNPMPNELIYPETDELDEILSVGGSFLFVLVLFVLLIFGFYKTITR